MKLLAFDPGRTVGWATFQKPREYRSGQFPEDRTRVWLDAYHLLPGMTPIDLLIVERFTYRSNLPKADLTPVEVIGVIKEWSRQNHVDIVWQTPAQGKFYFTDDRLKEMELYRVGQPHANDATRHLLYYLGFGGGITLGEDVVGHKHS